MEHTEILRFNMEAMYGDAEMYSPSAPPEIAGSSYLLLQQ